MNVERNELLTYLIVLDIAADECATVDIRGQGDLEIRVNGATLDHAHVAALSGRTSCEIGSARGWVQTRRPDNSGTTLWLHEPINPGIQKT